MFKSNVDVSDLVSIARFSFLYARDFLIVQ